MNVQLIAFFVLCAALGCNSDSCPTGMWGDDCMGVCGFCVNADGDPTDCYSQTGLCPDSCKVGYGGEKCDQPMCEEGYCGSGTCIAPDTCYCGSDINKVGPNCQDIRLRGLIGSAIAISTISIAVLMCGSVSKSYKKNKKAKRS